jgi:hypothetical protein
VSDEWRGKPQAGHTKKNKLINKNKKHINHKQIRKQKEITIIHQQNFFQKTNLREVE